MNKIERFKEIAEGLGKLYEQKNTAYGDSFGKSVQKYGKIAALTRISDKFNRLEALMLDESINAGDERLEDTLRDMASYAIMTVIELEESGDKMAQREEKINLRGKSLELCIPYYVPGDKVKSDETGKIFNIEEIITDNSFIHFQFVLRDVVSNNLIKKDEEELYTLYEPYETHGGSKDWSNRLELVENVKINGLPKYRVGEKVIYEMEDICNEHHYNDIPCIVSDVCLNSYECAAGIRYFCAYDLQEWGPRWEDDTEGEVETTYFNVNECYVKEKK